MTTDAAHALARLTAEASAVASLQAERDASRARVAKLERALRLALLWLPDPDMHARMSPEARAQLEEIRAAYTPIPTMDTDAQ